MRLEQLNKSDTDKEYKSQKKYIQELENLNVECADCWNSNDRVKALKIVIKVKKKKTSKLTKFFLKSVQNYLVIMMYLNFIQVYLF